MKNKIAIIGGTFDPIHDAHLRMGELVKEQWGADQVLFVPNGQPPHKRGVKTSQEHRLAMCRLAITGVDYFEVSDIEMAREGYYYTHDTLQKLVLENPKSEFGLVIGSDEALNFMEWHSPEKITKLAELLIVKRPPHFVTQKLLHSELPDNTLFSLFEPVELQITSSLIRDMVANQKSIRFLVPGSVNAYIKEHELYG